MLQKPKTPRVILGIDPGLQHTGWGIIFNEGNSFKFIDAGVINTNPKDDLANRLKFLSEELTKIIKNNKITEAAIEETFVNKNNLSSLKLGHARGALMVTVSLAGISLAEYSATKVKKSIVGVGRAEKGQIGMMVKVLLPNAKFTSEDAADALAVAICHANNSY
jgi:crossover junction endodeoxyribonuclease RuvC